MAEQKLSVAARKLRDVLDHKLPVCVSEEALKDVLKLIKACSTDELSALGLQPPALPTLIPAISTLTLQDKLQQVQAVISSLQYNHTSAYYYNVSKQRPLPAILATAASMLREPLPIKCIEAVFLGMLLTQGWDDGQLQRIPVGFKSMAANGQVYRHIVLVIHDPQSGLFGALGISRRDTLMYKDLSFHSLAELIQDYINAYSYWGHAVVKVRVGLPVEHDAAYTGPICWRYCTINPQKRPWESVSYSLGKHAAAAQQLQATFRAAALAASSKNSSINNGSLTPRSIATKPQPHITRPHTNGGSPLRASRQGLESPTQLAASGAAAVLPARRLHASSCSNHASNLRDFPSQALKVTCNSSGHPLLQLGDSVSARCVASHCEDAQDSSSDELEPNMSVCTFDSDSEVNLIVDAMRHKQAFATADLGPPAAGTAAHAS